MDDWKTLRDKYRTERVQDQVTWYEKKSAINKRGFYTCQTLIIISGALIPLLAGYAESDWTWFKYVSGLLGVVVVVAGGVLSLKKYQENWTTYRMTAERLNREHLLYENAVGEDYTSADEAAFKRFVIKAEQIMASENEAWKAYLDATNSSSENA
jgi:MFS family permease